jgi:CheY-like chemotaxis protein
VNVATPDVLNITELLSRVDNDHELVSELFFIFKSVFPSHLQRLSDAVANELSKQVEAESHALKGMLELDGAAVCREVRKKKDQGYVDMILLTSKGLKTDIVTGLGSGADDYLTKAFDSGELKARLRTGQRILHLEGRLV